MRTIFAIAAVVLVASAAAAASLSAVGAACGSATVTFVTTCTTISAIDAACWTPRVPLATDTVEFPAGTAATMPFAYLYTPLNVTGVIVASGAKVTMAGGAIQIGSCMSVAGTLVLWPSEVDFGTASTIAFLPDASVPMGTDCLMVNQGFTPRICGPGTVTVTGTLTLQGLYASLWAQTTIAKGATLNANAKSFLWGAVTNEGTIQSTGPVYLHGSLTNDGTAVLPQLRVDRWATSFPDPNPPIVIVNNGQLNFTSNGAIWFDYLSTDISYGKKGYSLQIVNNKNIAFNAILHPYAFAGLAVTYHNFGIISFEQQQTFFGSGEMISHGLLIANAANVYLNSYLSEGGRLETINGGNFHMGSGSGIDDKTTVICKRDAKKSAHASQLRISDRPNGRTNQTCTQQSGCPSPLCCGPTGVCETAKCEQNYGSGPSWCCPKNAWCVGSSHGPYCNGFFAWEVDPGCVEGLEFVDRYEWDAMRRRFSQLPLPRFGRHRYSLRGKSAIDGDGTGAVIFNEPLDVRGTVTVARGGVLRSAFDNFAAPFAGDGAVIVAAGGKYNAGIRTLYDSAAPRIAVERDGTFEVAAYGSVHLTATQALRIDAGATLLVDGQLLTFAAPKGVRRNLRHCGAIAGSGAIIGEVTLGETCN